MGYYLLYNSIQKYNEKIKKESKKKNEIWWDLSYELRNENKKR